MGDSEEKEGSKGKRAASPVTESQKKFVNRNGDRSSSCVDVYESADDTMIEPNESDANAPANGDFQDVMSKKAKRELNRVESVKRRVDSRYNKSHLGKFRVVFSETSSDELSNMFEGKVLGGMNR